MKQYPKMLYKDTLDNWKIADDAEHEKALLDNGYVAHTDLSVEPVEPVERDEVKAQLDALGVEYNTRAQTDTLVKLLAENQDK